MDKTPRYKKMSETADEIQKALKDEFDYCSQGYCTQHQCKIEGDFDNCPICSITEEKYNSLMTLEERKVYLASSGGCREKWIGLPYQDQLQKIYFDFISDQLDPDDEEISRAAFVMASISELKMLILNWNRTYPPLESYEQFWLVLVMMCKYNKRWSDDKGKWVKHLKDWWETSKEFLEEVEKKIDEENK